MALSYGFYNSVNKDRLYNATQFSQIFDGIINDGVYMSVLNHFQVQSSGVGMSIIVGGGRAWFNHTWTYNDSDLQITLDDSDFLGSRIDAVVLKINTSDTVRTNSIEIIKGIITENEPEKPTFDDTSTIFYHPLAYITINAGITAIKDSMIENAIGVDERTPFVTGIIEHVTAGEMLDQWVSEYKEWTKEQKEEFETWVEGMETDMNAWKQAHQNSYNSWIANQESAFETWSSQEQSTYESWEIAQKEAFDEWFAGLHYILDGDVAGHLQTEIDEINEREFKRYYDICTKTTEIIKDDYDNVVRIISMGEGVTATTTFEKIDESTIIRTSINDGVNTYNKEVIISGSIVNETYTKL